jgi:hypothetical protein
MSDTTNVGDTNMAKHGELTTEQKLNMLLAQMARIQEENETLRSELKANEGKGSRGLILKVSDKGAVTFNDAGVRRFGVTLYESEWEVLFRRAEEIKTFIAANKHKLSHIEKK